MSIHTSYSTVARDRALAEQRADRLDREAEAAAEQRQRDTENARIRAVRLQGIEDRREAERAERLAADDASFVDILRHRYLASDVTATGEDFERDLPELRRLHRLNAAISGPSDEELAAARRDASQYF